MAEILLMGWDSVNQKYVKLQVDANGLVKVDATELFENPPTEDETGKAPNSEWAYDHKENASAHHTKYTNTQAITAAKTIKLDDFATPDDNTDLNATNARHGLLKKLIDDTTKFLRSDGAWSSTAGIGGVTTILKANDETVNNSSTLQDDDELLLPVGADEVWHFLVWLRYDTGTTPDIKFSFTVPTDGWMLIISSGRLGSSSEGITGTPITSYGAGDTIIAPGAGGERQFLFWCFYYGGGTAGDVQLQWAQNVANASDTKIYSRSHIVAFRLA